METYNRLREFTGERRRFNPSNKEDLKELERRADDLEKKLNREIEYRVRLLA